jgi:N-acetylneuraminate synthase/N,N'-diacetyllegionaminate synthase
VGSSSKSVEIGARRVGGDAPCFVVAEIGVNHNGDVDLAGRLVEAAAEAGADAVKLQTFRAEDVVTEAAPKAAYQVERTDGAESQLDMLRKLELDRDAHVRLKREAESRGLVFLSTPFDRTSVELLADLGVDAFKIASPDVTNFPLLDLVAAHGRPVLLSTGLATLDEVEAGVARLRSSGAGGIVVLHCTSEYPAPLEESNLRAIEAMRERLAVPVGYSDHTEGSEAALAAVALGACVVERHFTLDRSLPGPDHAASVEPAELRDLVRAIRRVEAALGDGVKEPSPSERRNADVVRRSLVAASDLAAGTTLEADMLKALRPAGGISPARIDDVVGRRLLRALARNEQLRPDDLG